MSLKYFIKDKNIKNTIFVFILLPYLVLCLTVGGFHNGFPFSRQCNHVQQLASHKTDYAQIATFKNISQHDSETCQICQWLKTPSTLIPFLLLDTDFEFVCINLVRYSNPIFSLLSIHKFTIRPPPSFSCFSV